MSGHDGDLVEIAANEVDSLLVDVAGHQSPVTRQVRKVTSDHAITGRELENGHLAIRCNVDEMVADNAVKFPGTLRAVREIVSCRCLWGRIVAAVQKKSPDHVLGVNLRRHAIFVSDFLPKAFYLDFRIHRTAL